MPRIRQKFLVGKILVLLLPHGIIINGPSGIGKNILANKMCESIVINASDKNQSDHMNLINNNSHPLTTDTN